LEGKEGEDLGKKRMSKWKKYWKMGGDGFEGLTFLHNTKFSSFRGTKKLYWRKVFEGLHKFFKFKLC